VGVCIGNILDTEWGQDLLPNEDKNLLPDGDKTFYVFHIYSTENVFRKKPWKTYNKQKSAHSIHNLTTPRP
jgi:hypothetical protein